MKEVTVEKRPLDLGMGNKADVKAAWWRLDGNELATSVFSIVERIEARQKGRWILSITYASLYENMSRMGLGPGPTLVGARGQTGALMNTELLGGTQRSAHNVVKSCVDTATAKIAKNKPRVKFVTQEGDWGMQRKARKLTQYIDGLFYACKAYDEGTKIFQDAAKFGSGIGFVGVRPKTTDVFLERVLPLEIVVDDDDAIHGKPRQLHRRKTMSRDVAIAEYGTTPELRYAIEHAGQLPWLARSAADDVMVIESWHLPSSKDAKDGAHSISVDNACIFKEDYAKDYFPFVKYNYGDRTTGFWGFGLCEELAGIQLRINKLDKMIAAGQEFNCVPRVFVAKNSVVSKHKLWDFGVVEFDGVSPPVFNTAPGMAPEVYAERDKEIQRAYELTGVSQMSASGQKPPGLNSGAAQREFQDINSERFSIQGDRYETLFLDAARIMIDLSRDLYADHKELEVKTKGRKFITTIRWSEVDLKDDQFIMQCFPVSQLPRTPEGKLQFIQELTQAGFIDRDMAMELLQFNDVDDAMGLLNAAFDDAMMCIDALLDGREAPAPEPYMNLALAQKLAQSNLLRAEVNNAPEDTRTKLRAWMQQCTDAMKPPPAAPANDQTTPTAPGPEGGGTPLARPEKTPRSDMIPNVPPAAQAAA